MGAAVACEDIYGKNGERFERIFQLSLDEAQSVNDGLAWDIREEQRLTLEKITAKIDNLAFMTMLSVRDRIPIRKDMIGQLRDIYKSVGNLLENPDLSALKGEIITRLEEVHADLAWSICAIDMANSEKITSVFRERGTYA